jgi:hypothetical protein
MPIPQTSNSNGPLKIVVPEGQFVNLRVTYATVFDMQYNNQKTNAAGRLIDYQFKQGDTVDVGDVICFIDDTVTAPPAPVSSAGLSV